MKLQITTCVPKLVHTFDLFFFWTLAFSSEEGRENQTSRLIKKCKSGRYHVVCVVYTHHTAHCVY